MIILLQNGNNLMGTLLGDSCPVMITSLVASDRCKSKEELSAAAHLYQLPCQSLPSDLMSMNAQENLHKLGILSNSLFTEHPPAL